MSGITGIYNSEMGRNFKQDMQTTLNAMTHTLVHRGPDSSGTWIDPQYVVGLGHQRSMMRDLSLTGHEPMFSSCDRFVIVCDGEVYNRDEIAKDLQQYQRYLKGSSNTEVILEACAQWGIETALERINGVFAFALYDKAERRLFLARDRVGIKPLYYGSFDGLLIFGSDLKALRANLNWEPRLNRNALAAFMRHKYIPAPQSIYQNVYKLQPGCILNIQPKGEYAIKPFWDLRSVVESNAKTKSNLSDAELQAKLHSLLNDAVKLRMSNEEPLGSFLSGGIDSALITALMAKQSSRPINTFTIGFHSAHKDEAPYAKKIAQHLGTHHTELYIDSNDALALVDKIPYWYDEPYADHSQIPTLIICDLAKKYTGAVFSGDGSDLLFGNGNSYDHTLNKWCKFNRIPYPARLLMGNILQTIPTTVFNQINDSMGDRIGYQLQSLADRLRTKKPEDLFRILQSKWRTPDTIVKNAHEFKEYIWWDNSLDKSIPSFATRMMLIDSLSYLPDKVLVKMDRASMGVALEVRAPFLDYRLMEFASLFPEHMKFGNHQQPKWALRQILYQYVPQQLLDHPKMGFGIPLDQWLRGPLREWAENLLSEERLKSQNLFEYHLIRKRWNSFIEGSRCSNLIWYVLMAQVWINANPEVSL